jgi:hypothetical protein
VQVRPGAQSGAADKPKNVAALDPLSTLDKNLVQMTKGGLVSITVIDLDGIAESPIPPGKGDVSIGWSHERRILWNRDINAAVHRWLPGKR